MPQLCIKTVNTVQCFTCKEALSLLKIKYIRRETDSFVCHSFTTENMFFLLLFWWFSISDKNLKSLKARCREWYLCRVIITSCTVLQIYRMTYFLSKVYFLLHVIAQCTRVVLYIVHAPATFCKYFFQISVQFI